MKAFLHKAGKVFYINEDKGDIIVSTMPEVCLDHELLKKS
jgi:hypothetical protein